MNLKRKITIKNPSSGSSSKFEKRSKEILEKTYNTRNKQSEKSSGKSFYDQEKLDRYNIQILPISTKKEGEYYFNILPQSFSSNVPAHEEVSIHYGCGIRNDQYICMERYTEGKNECHRCNVQKEGWRKYGKEDKKIRKTLADMYPQDRVIYLMENLGPKYLKDEECDGILYIKDLPKKGCHSKIQDEVRDKKTGKMTDIADIEDDGKLLYMKVTIKTDKDSGNTFPEYGSIDLMDRDQPIDSRILKTLEQLIEDAKEEDMTAIQYLLHFPNNEEIKESMKTEVIDFDVEDSPKTKKEKEQTRKSKAKEESEVNLGELQETLEEMKNTFQIKRFCKENDIEEVIDKDMDRDEMIEAILTHFSEMEN